MNAGRDAPRKSETPRGRGVPKGHSNRSITQPIRHYQRSNSVSPPEPASQPSLFGVGATLLDTISEAWGPPERRVVGRLSWPCKLPAHRGYPVLTMGDDPRASVWRCLGECGTGDAFEFMRRIKGPPS